ncbi:hypothetical protein B566_EDAN012812 [Ephemera danica]|nr:hypothetical protein B566_EDAN012812 [Ephemera danica]
MRRCGRCQAAILSSELVMRARDLVFHVPCFKCSVCNSVLNKGDHFGMHGPNVFCQEHYVINPAGSLSPPCTPTCPPAVPYHNPYHTPPFPSPNDYHLPPSNPMPPQPPPNPSPCGLDPTNAKVYFNGAPAARQKGRPRKRKPKDLESMTANLGEYN